MTGSGPSSRPIPVKANSTILRCLFAFLASGATAAENAVEAVALVEAEVVKVVENPLARVVNLQLNGNVNFQKGTDERTQQVATLGATYPFDLPRRWNLFANANLPVIDQPVGATDRVRGLGDLTLTAFFSPPSSPHWVFGAGPVVVLPTAADDTLGQGKWDIGPAMAVVHTERAWTAGVVVAQSWSIAGANDRPEVSQLVISPFGTRHLGKGWYLFTAPNLSADWKARGSHTWTVPVGGGVGRIFRRGKHAVRFAIQAYDNVVRTDGAPTWQLRFTTGWVFPK
jgi:hypothetical protein